MTKESEYGGDTQGDTAFSHTGVVNGYTYYYRVSSVMTSGEESDLSQEVSTTVMDDFVVHFPDPVVEAEIRVQIGKLAPDDIMYSDLKAVYAFAPPSQDLYDLEGLQYCSRLRYIRLFYTQLSDIHPLACLNSAEELVIKGCQINDIRPLAALDGLWLLSLESNQISDISQLAGLTGLEILNLSNNQISDISSISNLIHLMTLNLSNNQISDLSLMVSNRPYEFLWMNLAGNHISDIAPLLNDNILTIYSNYLNIGDNPLNTISCNVYIPQLEEMGVEVVHSCP